MSDWASGVPVVTERFGRAERDSGRRTRAVTVWLRDSASEMTREPVRPLAPRRRIRIGAMSRVKCFSGYDEDSRIYQQARISN